MYLLYVSNDEVEIDTLENILYSIDPSKTLLCMTDGLKVLSFLQDVGKGQAYPAMIILQSSMPRLNGMQLLELLRTDDIDKLIPVVMLATAANSNEVSACARLGADLYLKPTNQPHWIHTMKRLCAACNDD